VIPRDVDTRDT